MRNDRKFFSAAAEEANFPPDEVEDADAAQLQVNSNTVDFFFT